MKILLFVSVIVSLLLSYTMLILQTQTTTIHCVLQVKLNLLQNVKYLSTKARNLIRSVATTWCTNSPSTTRKFNVAIHLPELSQLDPAEDKSIKKSFDLLTYLK